jgi:hypothetical protein
MKNARFVVIGLCLVLVVAACTRGGRYRYGRRWLGWASVPACQSAIRARALSEFGRKADVDFDGVAEEDRLERNRVRVSGRATIDRRNRGPIRLSYECITNTRRSEIVSATYRAAGE